MRRLIGLTVIAAVLYGGYWFVGRGQIETRMTTVLNTINDGPENVQFSDLSTKGFPSRFDTTITDLNFTDATGRFSWSAPVFQLLALAYRPNEVIAIFPTSQTFTIGEDVFTLEADDMRASGKVSASTALSLQTATVTLDSPRLRTQDGAELAMDALLSAIRQSPGRDKTYDIFLDARSIALPAELRRLIDPQRFQPDVIDGLRLDAEMELTEQIELNSAAQTPAEITAVRITEMVLTWGDMSATAIGDLTTTSGGLLNGSVTMTALNWDRALDLAVANGALDDNRRTFVTGIINTLDETPHIADTLTVTLTITNGEMMVGTLPLGSAPRLR